MTKKPSNFIVPFLLLFSFFTNGQTFTGNELINKSIEYHDPNNNWATFSGTLEITMEIPERENRISTIDFDFQKGIFKNSFNRDSYIITQQLENGNCSVLLNGSKDFSLEDKKKYRLSCDQAKRTRDYYTYLYGLPMKLKDPGTIIEPIAEKRIFKGKEYWVVQVNYAEEVGKDRWYFYLNTETYALEIYQFFHEESKNDGEYILLSEETEIKGIKIPKNRAWYYNNDNKYLGTDFLFKSETK